MLRSRRFRAAKRVPSKGWTALVLVVALSWNPLAAVAQRSAVNLDLGTAHAFPPAETHGQPATYLMGGLRADKATPSGNGLLAAIYGGRSLTNEGGDWLTALTAGEAWTTGSGLRVGLGVQAYGFLVRHPVAYEAVTADLEPMLRVRFGRATLTLHGQGGLGRSNAEFPFRRDRALVISADLWHYGGGPELRVSLGPTALELGGALIESAGGAYRRAFASLEGRIAGSTWAVGVNGWHTPAGNEVTGGLSLGVPLGGWSLRGTAGRTELDPLILTPSGDHGAFLLTVPVVYLGPRAPVPLYQITRGGSSTTVAVRFSVTTPDAGSVAVMGDFSLWEEIPMSKGSGGWVAEVEVMPGIYHFGFLVAGEWFVPDRAPGQVADEWGRTNATLLVP